jgi:ferredoxin
VSVAQPPGRAVARVVLDRDRCTGHGRCYALVPELFEADEYGHSVLLREEVVGAEAEAARMAAANCPERAIRIEEGSGPH